MLRSKIGPGIIRILRVEEVVVVGYFVRQRKLGIRRIGVVTHVSPVTGSAASSGKAGREINPFPAEFDVEAVVILGRLADILERVVVRVTVNAVTVGILVNVVTIPDSVLGDMLVRKERVARSHHGLQPGHIIRRANHSVPRTSRRIHGPVRKEVGAVTRIGVDQDILVDEPAFDRTACRIDHRGDIADVGDITPHTVGVGHPADLEPTVVFGHLVPVPGKVGRNAVAEILHLITPSDRKFEAAVRNPAKVLIRSALVADGRINRSLVENAVGLLVIIVGLERQSVFQRGELQAHVERGRRFPLQQIIRQGRHGSRGQFPAKRIGVARGIGRQIVIVPDRVVAQLTPGESQLQIVHPGTLQEILLRDAPSGRERGEESPPGLAGKTRRTVITEIDLGQIFVRIGVRDPAA